MEMLEKTIAYAKEKHKNVNQSYDGQPYEVHLKMVSDTAQKFLHLIPAEAHETVLCGCWVHDIIEDARETYNDVRKATSQPVAELAYALTNEKGRNRAERANDKYYAGIRETPYAAFVKFCDRIANVTHSIQTGSRMQEVYRKENPDFVHKIFQPELQEIADYLSNLLEE